MVLLFTSVKQNWRNVILLVKDNEDASRSGLAVDVWKKKNPTPVRALKESNSLLLNFVIKESK